MRADHLRRIDPCDPKSPWIVVGVYDVHYRANTVYDIDANLEDLRGDHPDVDRLLDARRAISLLNAIWSARCSLHPERKCPPQWPEPCPCHCARDLAAEHGHQWPAWASGPDDPGAPVVAVNG